MNTRERILSAITANKPAAIAMPETIILENQDRPSVIAQFKQMLESIGGTVIETANFEIVETDLNESMARGERVINILAGVGEKNDGIDISDDAGSLANIDRVFLKSRLGVAENGSVWLTETEMVNRLLPFICQHLVIVLHADSIVSNMHEAYKRINGIIEGYYIFLAGPSKTADIEQSLVIGAHGARSLLVYLINP